MKLTVQWNSVVTQHPAVGIAERPPAGTAVDTPTNRVASETALLDGNLRDTRQLGRGGHIAHDEEFRMARQGEVGLNHDPPPSGQA